jgi:hypothetical protein
MLLTFALWIPFGSMTLLILHNRMDRFRTSDSVARRPLARLASIRLTKLRGASHATSERGHDAK